ncbi:site-specific DNA-methyltransferase [Sphingobium sp. AS12]|uniref:site-specific DNA-methyltransferase n=1 Tax=Sphingobium sp. AS12 TaxID=2849495 RepID=UPI001C31446C|nr:site-specific DNA-methyltransferase [Sphingobium sp. AS12]MBV2149759.1 site-specific DNA-methyltransferase [Sphingobium sp. AS12]
MSSFDALVSKLREIFQIDRPELDFGVYRILNARAGEIETYLSTRLKAQVADAFTAGAAANTDALAKELTDKIAQYEADGVIPDSVPAVQKLREAIAAASTGASEHENQVFSHLLTFFSRYYDKGDFISQRRYKGDTYAIPYSGEEVVLHWANKDQYYTKSGEAFSNYGFKLEDGRTVQFRLVAADTAKDNRKDNDKERRFVLAEERTVTRIDEDGDEYEETIVPISEEDSNLVIRFDYKAMPKGSKQDALVDQAVLAVLADETVKARWLALTERAPTDKNPQRTLLEKCLANYTQKNTADYFIHKNLGGFLRQELDFYIKNEVMNLDDVQNAPAFGAIEKNLRMIQCLRAIALHLITFLASIEDFQKKLWLKKKFVVAAHYCVTLDRVPEELYPAIAANPKQWARWHDLGMRESAQPGGVDDLKASPYLMADTALFDTAFRADLLKAIPDIDASTDGLLVHGDNFQGLMLLQDRYREKVKCIYIDPPYNTGSDGFAYKDGYSHSSWLSMIDDRVPLSRHLMSENSSFFSSIDDGESHRLKSKLEDIFGRDKLLADIVWQKRYAPDARTSVSDAHEYILSFVTNPEQFKLSRNKLPLGEAQTKQFKNPDNDPRGPWKADNFTAQGFRPNQMYPITVPSGRLAYPPTGRCWGYVESVFRAFEADNRMYYGQSGDGAPAIKRFLKDMDGMVPWTWWSHQDVGHSQDGLKELMKLFGKDAEALTNFTAKPPSLIGRIIHIATDETSLVADYFAGSGTTGQAVIATNRSDGGKRKYLLIDQNDYFSTVLQPRIQKVVFSADWRDGKPIAAHTGISHAFKVIKVESYEDSLNNLNLRRDERQGALLDAMSDQARDDYLMRYMLDIEARGSLLSVEDFRKPFDYMLNIAVDSAGAYEPRKVDLVETFNYLIGLTVRHIDIQLKQGFVTVEGTLPSGEKTLILWRDCDVLDYDGLTRLCDKLAINPADSEYEVVYLNGDHNIPSVLTTSEAEGEVTKVLKLRQIEPAFLSAMFDVADV